MYQLTELQGRVVDLETMTTVSEGTWQWGLYQQFLAAGGVPAPVAGATTLEDLREGLLSAVTEARWQHETGGIEIGGVRVGTTLDDQNRLTGVLAAIQLGGLERVDFKAQSGWVELSASELQAIAQAISSHVQACFSAERAHHEGIALIESVEEADAYDLSQGWPDTVS